MVTSHIFGALSKTNQTILADVMAAVGDDSRKVGQSVAPAGVVCVLTVGTFRSRNRTRTGVMVHPVHSTIKDRDDDTS